MKKLTAAQRKLVAEHLEFLERVVMSVSKQFPSWIEAIDLYGAAYLTLCERARTYRKSKGAAFTTWAYQAVRRDVIREAVWLLNWRRSGEQAYSREPELAGGRKDWPDEPSELEARQAQGVAFWRDLALEYVRERLSGLSYMSRAVVELYYLDGLTDAHCARQLGIAEAAFRERRVKALRALWIILGDEEDELFQLMGTAPRRPTKDIAGWCATRYTGYFAKTGRRTVPSTRRRP